MDSLRGHGNVLRSLSWIRSYGFLVILLGLLVHYLVVLLLFGFVLLVLLVEPLLGGCLCLVGLPVLVIAGSEVVQEIVVEGVDRVVHWVSGSGPGRKIIRLNRKRPCTPRGFGGPISATCVEETASCGTFSCFHCCS